MRREAADSLETDTSHAVSEHETAVPQQVILVQPAVDDTAEALEDGRAASMLEMWFCEAEVIARNLKESGTRR